MFYWCTNSAVVIGVFTVILLNYLPKKNVFRTLSSPEWVVRQYNKTYIEVIFVMMKVEQPGRNSNLKMETQKPIHCCK